MIKLFRLIVSVVLSVVAIMLICNIIAACIGWAFMSLVLLELYPFEGGGYVLFRFLGTLVGMVLSVVVITHLVSDFLGGGK